MFGVLQGFTVILVIIGAGYLTGRLGIVKGEQRRVLNNVAFYVAMPAMLFGVLLRSDPKVLISPVMLVTTLSAIAVAVLFIVASRLWFKRDFAATTLGATASGYVNSNNLGLPVAMYILGDAAYVAPLLLVQLIVFAPVTLSILDFSRSGGSSSVFRTVTQALGRTLRSPIIIATAAGYLCALFAVPVPQLIVEPLDMLGAASIPMVLLSFGISLHGQRPLTAGSGRAASLTASGLKVVGMPLIAFGLSLAFGLDPHATFVATTIAALPTAQNVYTYAVTYQRGEVLVRDTVFLTTFASLPVLAAIALLLG
ncbi:AEC family transporter [Leucobacter sp. cx-42]|uniref:AEC family transporter n=1 Tax=unclassified Leucobacter TaxID=2621730 RepID=UPI00165DFD14|nr:AEC family transporter [Leucobacter sp. cx-42]